MGSSSCQIFLCCLLLSSSSLICRSSSYTGKDHEKAYHSVKVRSLLPSRLCSPSKAAGGLTVVHRHGPCSPSNPRPSPSLSQLLLEDEYRAASLRLRRRSQQPSTNLLDPSSLASLPTRVGRSLGTGNYVATVSLGTPNLELTVIFDTGSDITWVQCQPCIDKCHPQRDPIFDPSQSSTYSNVSCPSPECSSLLSATGQRPTCASSQCLYAIKYGDGSYSVGLFARETLTLSPSDVVPDFLFGCGESNEGLFGQTAGLLGLGRDPLSLVSQAAAKYHSVFSYCLPTSASMGHLTFGSAARSSGAVAFTPMLTDPTTPSLYFIDLVGIRVGGRQLPVPPLVFRTGGMLIDSGTVITRLPPTAYAALKAAFRQGMRGYPASPAFSILDTCFDLSKYTSVRMPAVKLLFRGGVVVDVAATGILVGPSSSQLCLAFAGNSDASDVGIIGNMQQMTVEVVYDLANGGIGFGAGGCG